MKKFYYSILISLFTFSGQAQTINWQEFMAQHDLVWNNNVDSNFFHGAFIGDGVQGAMIMQDSKNPNGLRMLMAHYKAISHYVIPNWEYCDSKVYAGNMIIAPIGKRTTQTMRMNLYDGEASGVITTDAGKINWRAFSDRKNNVFIVVLKGENGEANAKLGVREEWGISPRIYLDKKNPADYATHLPPKPELTKKDNIDLVINKMKSLGAHVVASQLIKEADDTQILYVAIGTSDNANITTAVTLATDDAVKRVQASVTEGYQAVTIRHREWWHNYMQSSYLEIKQDSYWQKFWYVQLYKFACASAENSDLIMDTQGAWIWQSGWAGVWWNLNVQLSYFPMYSANKLDAGRAFINGMNRIYKSGVLRQNANGTGINIGRSTTYDGKGNWGDEYGNMPWLLQLYWKYWKYSGNDSIGRALFPMLKDNATFLMSKLKKEADGKYHLAASRSPEYEDTGGNALHKDANYGLMSAKWVFQTLLEMNTELGLNDTQKNVWQEKLSNLTDLPTDENGFRVNADQGFDYGHRHFSHLIGIYPYHLINPEQGVKERDLIDKSLERWQTLTQANGAAGYTFTAGCAMYATLGKGDKAITTLDLMKSRNLLELNTMYYESGGAVIETPLAVVESIDYMLIQSWNGIIRIFPAVPARWKEITMKDFRTEGAFLVSASYNSGVINNVSLYSEKGKTCTILSPWKGKYLVVKDETGKMLPVTKEGEKYIFPTQAGKKYSISAANIPAIKYGKVEGNAKLIQLKFTDPMIDQTSFTGIAITKNGTDTVKIQQTTYNPADSTLNLVPDSDIVNTDKLSLTYSKGNILSVDSITLPDINNLLIDNLLFGSAPRLIAAITNTTGSEIVLIFNKKMKLTPIISFVLMNGITDQSIIISSQMLKTGDSTVYILTPAAALFLEDTLNLSYNGTDIQSADNGSLAAFTGFPVQNLAPGMPPQLIKGAIIKDGEAIQLTFDKRLNDVKTQLNYFVVKINGTPVKLSSVTNLFNVVTIALQNPIIYPDVVIVGFSGGTLKSLDGGVLKKIADYSIENTLSPAKIVSQSSTAYNGYAKLAVDGNTNGSFFAGSVSHTQENILNPWWMWNLNQVDSITQINIWNRTDCCSERLANFYVFVSREPFSSDNPATLAANPNVWKYYFSGKAATSNSIKVNTCGQYVRIQIPGTATLALAEVQVIRTAAKCTSVSTSTGDNINQSGDIQVYPNPVNGYNFTVDLSKISTLQHCQIEIYNIYGRLEISEVKQTGTSFELSMKNPVQNGIYLLLVNVDGKLISKKVVF